MRNSFKKVLINTLLAVILFTSLFGLFETRNVYAAANTKSGTASDIVAVASSQKHKSDGTKYMQYTFEDNAYHQWCAAFVSWCAKEAGAGDIIPKNGGCKQLYKNIINAGGTVVKSPKAGDIIFYHNNATSKGEYCHVGIVTKVSKSSVETVQGNIKLENYPDGVVYNTLKATSYSLGKNNKNYTIVYLRPNYNDSEDEKNTSNDATVDSSTNNATQKYETITNIGGATVNIINKASGKALDVNGSNSSSTNKSNVDVTTLNTNNKSSQFKFTKTSGGWFAFSPVSNSKLAVNPYSNTPKNGTNVNVYTKNNSDKTQGWIIRKIGDDYVILSAYNKSLALTATGTADSSNVKLATYSEGNSKQLWSFVLPSGQIWGTTEENAVKDDDKKVENKIEDNNNSELNKENAVEKEENTESATKETTSIVSGTKYYICNKASGKALDVYGDTDSSKNKSNVQIYTLNKSSKCAQFKVVETSGGWYSIVPMSNTKLAVNPYSDKPSNGTNVNVYTKDTSDKTQGWIFEKEGDYYIIRSAYKNSLVLTAKGTSDKSNVELATYSSGNSKQLWKLSEVK